MGQPQAPYAVSIWFRMSGSQVWAETRFTHPVKEIALSLARLFWDDLKGLDYFMGERP